MKIEHAALYVKDLESEKDFFVKYFGGKPNEKYHNTKTGFQSYFLAFDDGARLELMQKPEMPDLEKPFNRTGWAHVAFSLGSRERVDDRRHSCVWTAMRSLAGLVSQEMGTMRAASLTERVISSN